MRHLTGVAIAVAIALCAVPAGLSQVTGVSSTTPTLTPKPPLSTATPAPQRTPAPPPSGLKVDTIVGVLRPGNSFTPPDERAAEDVLTWDDGRLTADGVYEVQAVIVQLDGSRGTPEIIRVPREQRELRRPGPWRDLWLNQRCYRVRITYIDRNIPRDETGPWSTEVCTIRPVVDGPPVAPLPPNTGSGSEAPANPWPPAAGLALLVAGSATAAFLRRR